MLNEKAIDRLYKLVSIKIRESKDPGADDKARQWMKKGAAKFYEVMMHEFIDEDLQAPKEE